MEERLRRIGPNEVDHEKPLPAWLHLWQSYRNPFNLLLTVLAAISYVTEDLKATIVIGTMVILSKLIRFVQERRPNQAAESLKAMAIPFQVASTSAATWRLAGRREGGSARLLAVLCLHISRTLVLGIAGHGIAFLPVGPVLSVQGVLFGFATSLRDICAGAG